MKSRLLTPEDAAEVLNIPVLDLRRAVEKDPDGAPPFVQVLGHLRFDVEAVRAWVRAGCPRRDSVPVSTKQKGRNVGLAERFNAWLDENAPADGFVTSAKVAEVLQLLTGGDRLTVSGAGRLVAGMISAGRLQNVDRVHNRSGNGIRLIRGASR